MHGGGPGMVNASMYAFAYERLQDVHSGALGPSCSTANPNAGSCSVSFCLPAAALNCIVLLQV